MKTQIRHVLIEINGTHAKFYLHDNTEPEQEVDLSAEKSLEILSKKYWCTSKVYYFVFGYYSAIKNLK